MRIIHCADLHLESKLSSLEKVNKEGPKIIRDELLDAFDRMIEYANEHGVSAIIISGDLYDNSSALRKAAVMRIRAAISQNPDIAFYYLKGNHDMTDLDEIFDDEVPDNVYSFDDTGFTSYKLEDVVISGMELNADNHTTYASKLFLDASDTNIVVLHGQDTSGDGGRIAYNINFSDLKGKNIDYLAMGHVHSYLEGELDSRGVYVYPGCLCGRGFDEDGDKGFVLMDVEDGHISHKFIPFAKRTIHKVDVKVRPSDDMAAIIRNAKSALEAVDESDMVEVVLVGHRDMYLDISHERFTREILDKYFAGRLKDKTTVEIHFESYINDKSLKGEFVRLISELDVSEEEKEQMVELGIKALRKEETL